MARRRLSSIPVTPPGAGLAGLADGAGPGADPGTGLGAGPATGTGAGPGPISPPPIAQLAGDAAAEAALRQLADTVRTARESGNLVLDIPLAEIDPGHLARDRILADGDAAGAPALPGPNPLPGRDAPGMEELIASIRAHGQRMPIEVVPLAPGAPRPWGLLSGLRRLAALTHLQAEAEAQTGLQTGATARAVIRKPDSDGAAYVAMVEENELREGLSYFERARIAALTADLGVFADEQTALRTLFAAASRARRSKIGSFIALYRDLGAALRFPARIPERQGLKLAEAIRAGKAGAIRAALATADARDAEAEQAALTAWLAEWQAGLRAMQDGLRAMQDGPPPVPTSPSPAPTPLEAAPADPEVASLLANSLADPRAGATSPPPNPAPAGPDAPPARQDHAPRDLPGGGPEGLALRPGLTLFARRSGQRITLRLEGEEVSDFELERAVTLLQALSRR